MTTAAELASPPAEPPPSGHTRALATVWFTLFLDLVSFGIVIPVLPFYAKSTGASEGLIALLATAYSAAQFVMSPVLGRLSDRHGRRPVMLISIAGSTMAMLTLGFAQALWMLFLSRTISGVCNANVSTAHAYVADRVPPHQRARYMGMMGTAVGLGFIVGPSLGGLLARADWPQFPFFVGAALSLLNFLMAVMWLPESHRPRAAAVAGPPPPRPSLLVVARDPAFWRSQIGVMVAVYFSFFCAFAAMEATFALFAEACFGWGEQENGRYFAFIGTVIVLFQGFIVGRAVSTIGERRSLALGLTLSTAGFLTLCASPSWPFVVLGGFFIAGGNGLIMPSMSALVSRNSTSENQGINAGLAQSAGALGRIAGPMIAGVLFEVIGPRAPMGSSALLVVLVCLMVLARVHEARPEAGR
jgi:DHA1 family tetracycline resistance protein-like MFS transporter